MIWLAALLALLVSAGVSAVLAWCGPVDRPRERGSHHRPTPTAGGLAMIGGTAVAALLHAAVAPLHGQGLYWQGGATLFGQAGQAGLVLAFAALAGLFGALDDVIDLPARTKLLVQIALAVALALFTPSGFSVPITDQFALPLPGWICVPAVAFGYVVVLNAVNFMDGSNGLMAGAMAIVLGGLGLGALAAGQDAFALLLLTAAAAAIGFLPFNFPSARVFQGDAGALFLGGVAAGAWVFVSAQTSPAKGPSLFSLPVALLPLLTDVFLTLAVRARRSERLFEAHRDHLYQRWLTVHGGAHAGLAWRFWLIVGVFTLAGLAVAQASATAATLTLLGASAVAVIGWLWIDRSVRAGATSASSEP